MPITSVTSDPDALTMTIVGEYPVDVERLWDAWADPRQIERFWGPPGWPATFTRHDMVAGGRSHYVMTGPEGERSAGYWVFESVERPTTFSILDGFATDDGSENTEMPSMRMTVRFEPTDDGSRAVWTTAFADTASMEQLLTMGMLEGASAAFGQMDDVLADLAALVGDPSTAVDLLDDTTARVSRMVRGSVDQVWRAHHDPDLVRQWMLGPDGWSMPVCEIATEVGQRYRYEWEADDGSARFGFEGELLDAQPPHRSVTTEQMVGTDGPATHNELTLRTVAGGTLVTIVITYPSKELRDEILATGMVDGMETSYARMETTVL